MKFKLFEKKNEATEDVVVADDSVEFMSVTEEDPEDEARRPRHL